MVRTRFAPSPTGYLHIGGVRTALFNWLFARAQGGKFVLRIDDTDRDRHVEEALQPILDGFRWLGIDWDEGPQVGGELGPYYQSERGELYRGAAAELIDKGLAYWDYATPDEIALERDEAKNEKRRFLYSRRWMAKSDSDREQFEAQGRSGVVRLMMPREGACEFRDRIRGDVSFEWAGEQDHVIQRADGSCLYHLASVVDDHAMQISHVIRAEEHLSNTPRQIFIARGLGYELPEYAHLPYVAEPGSRNKLSKRKLSKYLKHAGFAKLQTHADGILTKLGITEDVERFNPVIVDFYERVGYLPHAVVNYLMLLGWALDDKTEFFTRDEMLEHFSLERVNKAPASFDPDKLFAFQEHYSNEIRTDDKTAACLPYVEEAGWISSPVTESDRDRVHAVVAAAADRIKVAGDVLDYGEFFLGDDLEFDEKAFAKRLAKAPESTELLDKFRGDLETLDSFTAEELEAALKSFVEREGIKIGQVIHALRVAVTGKAVGFGMFETLAILGKESSLLRIARALQKVAAV